jgi:hypothetical protein
MGTFRQRVGVSVFLFGVLFRSWRRGEVADQVQLSPVQEFPFHLFPRLQADGRRQRLGKIDMETRRLSFGTDRLHFYYIFCLHNLRIPCRVP